MKMELELGSSKALESYLTLYRSHPSTRCRRDADSMQTRCSHSALWLQVMWFQAM
jgi:hypothetical protein